MAIRQGRSAFRWWKSTVALGSLVLGLGACSDTPLETQTPESNFSIAATDEVSVSEIVEASGYNYVAVGGLTGGAKAYIDRTNTYHNVPSALEGQTFIQTANNDRGISRNPELLTFRIDREATVYVAYNSAAHFPGWLSTRGFSNSGQKLTITVNGQSRSYTLWSRTYAAGKVQLGSNRPGDNSADMYTVIVKTTAATTSPPPPTTTTTATGFAAVVTGIRPRGYGQGTYSLRQPATGRKMFYVATTGSDNNPGTSSAPFRTINKAAQVAVAGDVVTIRGGTYRESVRVRNAGTASKPIVFQAAQRGQVVLTGGTYHFTSSNWTGGVKQSGGIHVTLRGLIFRSYARTVDRDGTDPDANNRAAVGAIRGWHIEDCLFDKAGYAGVDIRGDSVTISRSTFQYVHTLAMAAWTPKPAYLRGIVVRDVVLRGNNARTDPIPPGTTNTRVAKFWRTAGAVIDNIESYENQGPGFWFDTDNIHYTVRNSYFHHNRSVAGRGLYLEVNGAPGGALVENNVFANNQREGMVVANSQGVRVTGNLFVNNERSIFLVHHSRGSAYPLKDISITKNSFKGWQNASGMHPGGDQIRNTTPARQNITADYNVYDPGVSAELTYWSHTGWIRSIADMRSKLGWERNGKIATVQWPLN